MINKGKWGGSRVGSGRRKSPKRLVNECIKNTHQHLPALFESLTNQALEGDREAAIYLIDRILGKPKQQTEIDVNTREDALYAVAVFRALSEEQKQLKAPTSLAEHNNNSTSQQIQNEAK